MKTQVAVGLAILGIGGGLLGGEYLLVRWSPRHKEKVREETLTLLPYRNDALGIEMQVAAGLYGKVEDFAGGIRITRPTIASASPSLSITSQPNPDHAFEFPPEILAKWQTRGTYENIPQYSFEHTKIMNRDAVLIWQLKNRFMNLTARVITPERIVEAECTPGGADEPLFSRACEASVRTLNVAGPEPPAVRAPEVQEIPSMKSAPSPASTRR